MTGKNFNWHKAWQRLPNGRLRHISGAEFTVERGDGYTDINAAPAPHWCANGMRYRAI